MRPKLKIKVPGYIKPQDYKLYVSFCMEQIEKGATPEEIDKSWRTFKKSLKDAVKGIVKRAKELQ